MSLILNSSKSISLDLRTMQKDVVLNIFKPTDHTSQPINNILETATKC